MRDITFQYSSVKFVTGETDAQITANFEAQSSFSLTPSHHISSADQSIAFKVRFAISGRFVSQYFYLFFKSEYIHLQDKHSCSTEFPNVQLEICIVNPFKSPPRWSHPCKPSVARGFSRYPEVSYETIPRQDESYAIAPVAWQAAETASYANWITGALESFNAFNRKILYILVWRNCISVRLSCISFRLSFCLPNRVSWRKNTLNGVITAQMVYGVLREKCWRSLRWSPPRVLCDEYDLLRHLSMVLHLLVQMSITTKRVASRASKGSLTLSLLGKTLGHFRQKLCRPSEISSHQNPTVLKDCWVLQLFRP